MQFDYPGALAFWDRSSRERNPARPSAVEVAEMDPSTMARNRRRFRIASIGLVALALVVGLVVMVGGGGPWVLISGASLGLLMVSVNRGDRRSGAA